MVKLFKPEKLNVATGLPDLAQKIRPARRTGRRSIFSRFHQLKLRGLISLLIIAIVWEVAARTIITNKLAFVPLSTVWAAFLEMVGDGSLWKHAQVSLLEFGLGFGLAAAAGIAGGMVLGVSRTLRDYLDPVISILYSTPIVALAPLFIVWFGIGLLSKVVVIFLFVVFPVLINTTTGITTIEKSLLEVGRSFCAGRMQIFTKILFHAALPYIMAGLRMGVSRGVVAVVVAELFGTNAGLGLLILESSQTYNTPTLLVVVILLAGSGLALAELFKTLEQWLAPWRVTSPDSPKESAI